jgi:hypothetical protein
MLFSSLLTLFFSVLSVNSVVSEFPEMAKDLLIFYSRYGKELQVLDQVELAAFEAAAFVVAASTDGGDDG